MQLEFELENASNVDVKIKYLEKSISEIRESCEKVRKGLFARHNELAKLYLKKQEEIDQIKMMLRKLITEKECWIYQENEKLFEIKAI